MKKYKYVINNLDCAKCASEIEESLNKNKDFKNAIVNFNTSKISFESEKDFKIEELNRLIKKVEPDAYLSLEIEKKEYHIWTLILGVIIGFLGFFIDFPNYIKIILYLVSYSLLLYKIVINAFKLLIKSHTINENALITISCLGALIIGEVMEGIMVIFLYTIGKILEEKAINNSRKSITNLLDIKQNNVHLKTKNEIKEISLEDIKINDILIVKKGELIPVDGTISKGESLFDTSKITGESTLVEKKSGDSVLSGFINTENVIELKADTTFINSTVSKILELLETATDKKTKTETAVSKISKIYTPIIIILSIFIVILLPFFNVSLNESIYRSLTFLVISCPCAIAISIPLSYFTGIGIASKNGILIKGSNYLDNLSNAKTIIFDKTGTLTSGAFSIKKIDILDKNYDEKQILDILNKGESLSNHIIAKSLTLNNKKIDNSDILDFKEIEGKGISFKYKNSKVLIGNKTLCNCGKDAYLHINIDSKHIASITINDGIKENARETILNLKKLGLKTYMFTGDKKESALNVCEKLKIDDVKYEMLPTDKFAYYERVARGITIFVGDGVNDAPVLKRADIGISMGNVGTDQAIEASDIVLMKDDLKQIETAINISKFTKKIIKQNLLFALTVKIMILILSVFGFAGMWFAVFADTGVTLITVLNTLRIMKKEY